MDKKLYKRVREAKLGQRQMPAPLGHLSAWIAEKYDVRVVYIESDRLKGPPSHGRRRLQIFLDTGADYYRVHEDHCELKPHVRDEVSQQVVKLMAEAPGEKADWDKVHIVFSDFSEDAKSQALQKFMEKESKRLRKELARDRVDNLVCAGDLFIFYKDDADVRRFAADGTSERIRQLCYQRVMPYDEFGYLQPESFTVVFDSKENLDRNYKGSLFYYLK